MSTLTNTRRLTATNIGIESTDNISKTKLQGFEHAQRGLDSSEEAGVAMFVSLPSGETCAMPGVAIGGAGWLFAPLDDG
jgi:hypothetical protein